MDWNLADEHFPDAVQLVDRFHDQATPTDAAKSIYGAGTDLSKHWAHERYDELDGLRRLQVDTEMLLRGVRERTSMLDDGFSSHNPDVRPTATFLDGSSWKRCAPLAHAAGVERRNDLKLGR